MDHDKIYISEMVALLAQRGEKRAEHTIRQWISERERSPRKAGALPEALMPEREGGRRVIFWRLDQVDGLVAFAKARVDRRGWQHPQDQSPEPAPDAA